MSNHFVSSISIGLLLLAAGCAAERADQGVEPASAEAITWPAPPAEPRVRFLRSASGPKDLGIAKSFFRRLIDMVSGSSEEAFVRPTGVAEHDGVLYVADPGVPALWILDSGRKESVRVVEAGDEPLRSPVAVTVRPDGAVFVADSALKKVLLFDRAGKPMRFTLREAVERPAALAYDASRGWLFVADSASDRIRVYDSAGIPVRSWGQGGAGDGEFNHPTHLWLDRQGVLLVTDALNFRIQAFDADGHFLWKFGRQGDGSGNLAAPKGIASDGAGHVYVVDALFDAVQVFERDGSLLLAFGEQGARPGQFWLPGGVYINARDEIYVADAYNRRVQEFVAAAGAPPEAQK